MSTDTGPAQSVESTEHQLKAFIAVQAALGLSLMASWMYWYGVPLGLSVVVAALLFAVLTALTTIFPIRVTQSTYITVLDVGLVCAVMLVGPFWAALAALPYAAIVGGKEWLRAAYAGSTAIVAVFCAGAVFLPISEPLLLRSAGDTFHAVYGAFLVAAVLLGVNYLSEALLMRLKYGRSFGESWRDIIEPYLLSDVFSALTAAFAVLVFVAYGPLAAVVAVVGAVASQVLVYRSREQRHRISELEERNRSLERSLSSVNTSLGLVAIQALGKKDGYTHRHAAATAVYARDIASEMGLAEERVSRVRLAGLLHNIGLVEMPEELLLAGGRLNSVGGRELEAHCELGERALAAVPEFKELALWVRHHHERMDGRGYPDRLPGPWIPLEARILAAAQAYAAMVLDNPHRPGMRLEEARRDLIGGMGTQFDEGVVRAFLRVLDTETEGYRAADDFRFLFPVAGEEMGGETQAEVSGS